MKAFERLWATRWKMRVLDPQEMEGKLIGSGGPRGVRKCVKGIKEGGKEIRGRVSPVGLGPCTTKSNVCEAVRWPWPAGRRTAWWTLL